MRWFDSLLAPDPERPKDVSPTPSKRTSSKWGFGFLRWAALRLTNLIARLTRRLQVRCGGIDPALLGALTGGAAILHGILGTRRFAWIPDFAPGGPWIGVRWDLSISIWKLVRWTGETFVDRKRRPDRGRDL